MPFMYASQIRAVWESKYLLKKTFIEKDLYEVTFHILQKSENIFQKEM